MTTIDTCKPYRVKASCGHEVIRHMRAATAGVAWSESVVLQAPNGVPCAACAADEQRRFTKAGNTR